MPITNPICSKSFLRFAVLLLVAWTGLLTACQQTEKVYSTPVTPPPSPRDKLDNKTMVQHLLFSLDRLALQRRQLQTLLSDPSDIELLPCQQMHGLPPDFSIHWLDCHSNEVYISGYETFRLKRPSQSLANAWRGQVASRLELVHRQSKSTEAQVHSEISWQIYAKTRPTAKTGLQTVDFEQSTEWVNSSGLVELEFEGSWYPKQEQSVILPRHWEIQTRLQGQKNPNLTLQFEALKLTIDEETKPDCPRLKGTVTIRSEVKGKQKTEKFDLNKQWVISRATSQRYPLPCL